MARKLRIHYPGAVYHVLLRGNAGEPIFFDDRDRFRFYLFLQQTVERFGCRIHGFCLMTNHAHLIMQAGDIPLARVMQNLSLRYTKWINYSQGRTGHLFQGRYKALLVDADEYLLEIVRYVHLNPVRAGMVPTPEEYPWSGHRAYLATGIIPWLACDWVLSLLSDNVDTARRKYIKFVEDGMMEQRRNEFHVGTCEGRIIGNDKFVDETLRSSNEPRLQTFTLSDVAEVVCRRYGISVEKLRAPGKARPATEARALVSLIVRECGHLSLTELGKFLNRDIAPLGRSGRLFAEKAESDNRLSSLIAEVKQEIYE